MLPSTTALEGVCLAEGCAWHKACNRPRVTELTLDLLALDVLLMPVPLTALYTSSRRDDQWSGSDRYIAGT
jgi:hypothetical protein